MAEEIEEQGGMKLKDFKIFINSLPEEFDDFILINGEVAGVGEYYVRVDKPIVHVEVDTNTQEVLFLHQAEEELEEILEEINKAAGQNGTTEGPQE